MKKAILPIFLLLLLLLCACGNAAPEAETTAVEPTSVIISYPQDLLGTWSSASAGELNMTETFTFYDDGMVYATAVMDGEPTNAINGTFYTVGNKLYCHITAGVVEPIDYEYIFQIDGRELLLTDSDGTSQFLRVS